jgi:hypothetical protein
LPIGRHVLASHTPPSGLNLKEPNYLFNDR